MSDGMQHCLPLEGLNCDAKPGAIAVSMPDGSTHSRAKGKGARQDRTGFIVWEAPCL